LALLVKDADRLGNIHRCRGELNARARPVVGSDARPAEVRLGEGEAASNWASVIGVPLYPA
jgi:hypothetical protein